MSTVTTVRYDGITHDFMMLNPLSGTHATRAAVAQATSVLREALHSSRRCLRGGPLVPLRVLRRWLEPTTSLEAGMSEIKVISISAEEAEHGVAELWADGQQIAYTVLDDGEVKLRFVPHHDGTPVVVGLRSLADALAEVDRLLALY